MYKRLLAAALSCSLLGVSSMAWADDHRGRDRDRHEHRKEHRHEHRGDRHDKHDRKEWRRDHHRDDRWHRARRGPPPRVVVEKHYHAAPRHHHRWARGEYVPRMYRGSPYVVADYHAYHLAPPPRGHQWINVGADYFLIGVATGVVLQAVLGG